MRGIQARSKVWLLRGGQQVFGEGKAAILRAVRETGSLSGAARKLNMSYRHTWSCIRAAESRLGRPLITRTRGGKTRGGAALTDFAADLLDRFAMLDEEVRTFVDRRFNNMFKEEVKP